MHLHNPSFSEWLLYVTSYVTGASIAVNVLPKECVFDKYPRTQRAYRASVAILAISALNLRKFLPTADLKIPGLGFDQYEHDHPEFFVAASQEVRTTTTTVVGVAADSSGSGTSAKPAGPVAVDTKTSSTTS